MKFRSELLQNADYRRLLAGQTISSVGSAMSTFVFTLLALAITHSTVQAGLVGAAHALGSSVTMLPAGALVDRWSRRTVLLVCSAGGGVMYASVAIATYLDRLSIVHLIVVSALSGVTRAFFLPAQVVALRQIVRPQDLGQAMAANEGRQHLATLTGGPLGGALYAVFAWLPIAVDAISYFVLTVLLKTMKNKLPAPARSGRESVLTSIKEGGRWLVRQRAIRLIAVVATLLNFAASGILLVLIMNLQRHGVRPSVIGLLETGVGVGGILGAMASPLILKRFTTGRIAIGAAWLIAASFAATASTANPFVLIPMVALAVFAVPALNSSLFGYQVLVTPDGLQGRAQSAITFLATSMSPLAPVLAGLMLAHVGAVWSVLLFVGVLLLSAVLLTASSAIRDIPLLAEVPRAETAPADGGPEASAKAEPTATPAELEPSTQK
ncbi:MFS transporter [Catellatospora sp. TT07R-123]|uniref:MFS transporter n=1 Tax=Catellatospora sp. TT07R-123 TaxID=2733863 RepID=UPI001B129CE6|nr:MFS transporter [Catellatospora sp. TT07R-123]GHJ50625.1 MFS transporter [Catellatospora sp. TT07R-123]